MTLITRINRLFAADMNAVLDQLEEPEVVLKQAVRDMQAATQGLKASLAATEEQIRQHSDVVAHLKSKLEEFSRELDLCLDAQDHELARGVMRRRLETGRRLESANRQLTTLQTHRVQQSEQLIQQQQELESLQQKAALVESAPVEDLEAAVTEEEIDVALLRHREERRQQHHIQERQGDDSGGQGGGS